MTLATLAAAACLAVGGDADQIRLRDLAAAFPAGTSLPEAVVGLAPIPGVERRFGRAELERLAARFDLPAPEREVCVSRPAAPLDPARILAAMRAALPEARIELLEYSRYAVPDGVLEFPLATLRSSPAGALWNGSIRYGAAHRAPVWARVQVTVASRRVIAGQPVRAGAALDPGALHVETRDEFPGAEPMPSSIEAVAGLVARRPIRAGEALRSAWLEPPKAVARGETVEVEVREGGALLRLPGQALASGAIGQTIPILNPDTRRRFPAVVEGKGKVAVGKSAR